MHCIEESTCDIVGTLRRPPQPFGARGIVPPLLSTRYAPGTVACFLGWLPDSNVRVVFGNKSADEGMLPKIFTSNCN